MDGPVRMVKKGEKEKGSWTHGVEDILLGFGFPLDDETLGRGFDPRRVRHAGPLDDETLGRGFDPRRVRHAGPLDGETQGRGFDSRWVRPAPGFREGAPGGTPPPPVVSTR